MKHQAPSRNSLLLSTSNSFLNAGPGTEMVLYEAAAHGLASTVSGGHLWEEARMSCEVGHAAARQGMTCAQANEIANQLPDKYEDHIADAPKGKPFQECYDVRTARPMPWHLDMYNKIKNEVAAMGIEFPY